MQPTNFLVMPPPLTGETGRVILSAMFSTTRAPGMLATAAGFGLGLALMGAVPGVGQPAPQRVISDTPEYCLRLLDRVSEMVRVASVPPPQEVASLSTEGQRMCDQGQTRGGILRLRRALMLMMHGSQVP